MKASNIRFVRIDNRLVHGQVGITWVNSLRVDTLVVVDDDTFYDGFSRKLMETTANTSGVSIRFYRVDDFVEKFNQVVSSQKLFLVLKTPHELKRLCEGKIPITKANIGNMHYERGKVSLNKKVYVSKEDANDFNYLLERDVELFYQEVPGTPIERITLTTMEEVFKSFD